MTSSQLKNGESHEVKRPLSFSIDHILNKAGKSRGEARDNPAAGDFSVMSLPWLHCTRYCPPKIPRRRDQPQRRQLGRHPRIPFSTRQLAVLEEHFRRSPYLSSQEVKEVSRKLDLADIRVKIWFQNRRARERRERSTREVEQQSERFFTDFQSSEPRGVSLTGLSAEPSTAGSCSKPLQSPAKSTNFGLISGRLKMEPPIPNFNFA